MTRLYRLITEQVSSRPSLSAPAHHGNMAPHAPTHAVAPIAVKNVPHLILDLLLRLVESAKRAGGPDPSLLDQVTAEFHAIFSNPSAFGPPESNAALLVDSMTKNVFMAANNIDICMGPFVKLVMNLPPEARDAAKAKLAPFIITELASSGKRKPEDRRIPDDPDSPFSGLRKTYMNHVAGFAFLVLEGGIKPDGAIEMIMRLMKKKESRLVGCMMLCKTLEVAIRKMQGFDLQPLYDLLEGLWKEQDEDNGWKVGRPSSHHSPTRSL